MGGSLNVKCCFKIYFMLVLWDLPISRFQDGKISTTHWLKQKEENSCANSQKGKTKFVWQSVLPASLLSVTCILSILPPWSLCWQTLSYSQPASFSEFQSSACCCFFSSRQDVLSIKCTLLFDLSDAVLQAESNDFAFKSFILRVIWRRGVFSTVWQACDLADKTLGGIGTRPKLDTGFIKVSSFPLSGPTKVLREGSRSRSSTWTFLDWKVPRIRGFRMMVSFLCSTFFI